MKILDRYILKSFLVPFFATFLIVLFVLVMQALWLAFDEIAGKGIDVFFILKFLYYTALIVTPQALPIGVLLSSIMALGNLSEHYEFAAAKSAGISLPRLVRPLVFLAIGMSALNFLFLNNVYPYAVLKQKNLYLNIKKKKPALALIPGSFNTEIPNYHIKFNEKYGEEDNLLKDVIIYDLSSRRGNRKIITAKRGKIISEEGSRYMTLELYDGFYFENTLSPRSTYKDKQKLPASNANFKEYSFNIDISSFDSNVDEDDKYTKNYNMLSLNQLKDTIPDLKSNYDEYITNKARAIYYSTHAKKLYKYPDSLINKKLDPFILDNFTNKSKLLVLDNTINKVNSAIKNYIENNKSVFKYKRKALNNYEIEFYNRIAFSLSCLILFFIGAPLGSIIRKGGMGLPMILAIAIYVIYFFTNTFGRNLAEESSVTAILGSWIAAIIMVPFAFLLTRRASKDKGLFNFSSYIYPVTQFFKKIMSKKTTT
ncbi:MAG: LptF/LptG family permease [Flavobacteriaceae bacterium]